MVGEVPQNPSGMFPQAKPEDRYQGAPDTQEAAAARAEQVKREAEEAELRNAAEETKRRDEAQRVASQSNPNPPHPSTSFPPATEPAVPDPNAVPSNIRQREEVRQKEDEEFERTHGGVDRQFQQPGAPSQQYARDSELDTNIPLSEKTRLEMEAGKKNLEGKQAAAARSREDMNEQERLEADQVANASGAQGEQAEARRKEEEERRKTWGDPPAVNRDTVAGAKP